MNPSVLTQKLQKLSHSRQRASMLKKQPSEGKIKEDKNSYEKSCGYNKLAVNIYLQIHKFIYSHLQTFLIVN